MTIQLTKGLERKTLFTGGGGSTALFPVEHGESGKQAPREREHEQPTRVRSFDPRTHKRCIRCREIKEHAKFGQHDDNADGKQVICYECKGAMGKRRMEQNVRAKLRHHIATRVTSQLGPLCPEGLTRDLTKYLGYTLGDLVKGLAARLKEDYPDEGLRLRDVLNAGWHVDHIHPLSKYRVVVEGGGVDWDEFRRCWQIDNLRAIPAAENLAKGAKVQGGKPEAAPREREDGKPF